VGNNSLITSVDLSNNTSLQTLYLNNTAITTLDLSNHPQLTTLGISNTNLNSLNLQNGNNTSLTTFYLTGNASLYCVLVDYASYATTNFTSVDAQVIFSDTNCNFTSIPDANFEAALVTLGYDTVSGDGQVLTDNINTITSLDLDNANISDMTGIEDFTALTSLLARYNNFTSIDISNNTALTTLNLSYNSLTTLDVSANTDLRYLYVNYNSLSSIDVSNNTALIQFHVIDNALTALDVTNNTSLTNFQFHVNSVSSIDLSNNPVLNFLSGRQNSLTTLDVSNNPLLAKIWCGGNAITSIDITNNPLITVFQMGDNNLTYANLKNGANTNITSFYIGNNANLECIVVDDAAYSTSNWTGVDATASFTENNYCRYTSVPDTNFEAALEALGYDDISNDGQVPTALIENVTSLQVAENSISDVTGLEDFTSLTELEFYQIGLASIDLSSNTLLEKVSLDNNPLTSIDISSLVNLTELSLEQTDITSIDVTANTALIVLDVSDNDSLNTLDVRNGNNSNFTSFDATNNTNLTCISVDDLSYSTSSWSGNIDNGASFTETDYCAYTAIPDANFEASLEAQGYDDILGDGQVPTALIEGVTNLDVSNEGITDLTGIEDFVALTELSISESNIPTLDVSNNTNLKKLEAYAAGLTSLDISQNINLEELIVYSNSLTILDLSNCTSLQYIQVYQNAITSLDFSANTALDWVEVHDNQLTELNVQNGTNTIIQFFDASNNSNLSCIRVDDAAYSTTNWTDIDPQTSFSATYCRYTAIPEANFESRLESIIADDISGDGQVPTALIEVITNLNASNRSISDLTGIEDFTALQKLDVSSNNLTSLELSNNVNLEELNTNNNLSLATVNVTGCTALERMNAEENAFSTLDLSANTQLEALFITDNSTLSEIDLSNNTSIRALTLSNLDNISTVNVSQNTLIDSLEVTNNLILSEFNVKNGANTDIVTFAANNNDILTCILVDDASYSTSNWNSIDNQASFSDTYCRYTQIPDANFETALEALINDDVSGDGQVPTALIEVVTSLDIRSLNISDLTGIEDFSALEALYCSGNNLTSVDVSNLVSLQTLWALDNNLTTLDVTNNAALSDIRVENNDITSIDLSNQTNLVILQIDRNELTAIDVSNSPLITRFRVYNNNISNIDLSTNTSLSEVRVQNNALVSLNLQNGNNTNISTFAADQNEFLDCILVDDASYSTTNWTSIDAQTSFNETECVVAYTAIPDSNFESELETLGYDDISGDNQVPTAYIKNVTTLDIRNLNISDLTGIADFTALVDLDVSSNNLTAIDLSSNTLLEDVDIDSNDLTAVTLPTNGSLITFSCNNNSNLTSLDFSGNTSLQTIQCINNGLTSVNLTGLNALTSLAFNNNNISTIDLADATNLETFVIEDNSLTSIDVSNNTSLTYLNVASNNISSLDISNQTALEYLLFSDNSIASIDVSGQSGLIWLFAGGNLLTSIDVTANTVLEKLWVNDNQLTSVDIASNVLLVEFVCYNNAMTTIDASGNAFLEWFLVNDNALTSVNLQNGNNTSISIYASNNNPDLSCIQVDDATYSTTNWTSVDAATTFSESACTTDFTLGIDVFLQGALLNPNTGEENLMRDDLRVAGFIPTTSPYGDGLTCESTVFDTTGDNAIVDWILIEFRDASDSSTVTYSQSALLQRDGDVVDVDGVSDVAFSFSGSVDYYVALRHRNHLGIMTTTSIPFVNNVLTTIDFTDATDEITHGSNAQTDSGMPDGVIAMWAGDCNDDGSVQYSGTSPDTPDILSAVLNDAGNFLSFPTYSITEYNTNDINLDGIIQYSGTDPDTPYILQNVLAHPDNFLGFSTYQITGQIPENE
jgi:Leucine-rich repeat (LRR) protein